MLNIFGLVTGLLKTLSFIKTYISKKLFLRHYEISHNAYLKRYHKIIWKKLSPYIEYDIRMKSVFSNDKNPCSKIYIRPILSEDIKKIEIHLTVIATKGNVDYPHPINYIFKNSNIACIKLDNIPLQCLWVKKNNIYTPYDFYYIRIDKLSINNYKLSEEYTSVHYHPFYCRFLNDRLIYKWEKHWNLSFYESAKTEFKLHIMAAFLESTIMLWDNKDIRYTLGEKFRIKLVKLLTSECILNSIFWLGLILQISSISEEGYLHSKYFTIKATRKKFKILDAIIYKTS